MKSTVLFGIVLFGIPSLGSLFLAIDIILHIQGKRKSFNKHVIKKCSTEEGRKKAKVDVFICFFVFFTLMFILLDGLLNN